MGNKKQRSGVAAAADWSSDHETDSDDSLQPYDLSEDDDDGNDHAHCNIALPCLMLHLYENKTDKDAFPILHIDCCQEAHCSCLSQPLYAAQHSTAQHCTAQHSTAQHSTAQHCTALHSTAQHSTAQHSTAQHGKVTYATQCLCKEQSVVAGHPLICPPTLTNVSLCRTDVWHQARGLTAAQQTPAFTCFFT